MILAIYGIGASGREVFELVQECNELREKWEEIVFIDDTSELGTFKDCKRYSFEEFKNTFSIEEVEVVIAIGEPKYRKALYEKVKKCGFHFGNVIHSNVYISPSAVLGTGIVLYEGVRIQADAIIKDNVFINGRSLIGHDVEIGEHCQISCYVALAGGVKIGTETFIGVSVCVRDHLTIGEACVLSMGSIVLKDVRPHKIVMGNPAREIAENTEQRVFK